MLFQIYSLKDVQRVKPLRHNSMLLLNFTHLLAFEEPQNISFRVSKDVYLIVIRRREIMLIQMCYLYGDKQECQPYMMEKITLLILLFQLAYVDLDMLLMKIMSASHAHLYIGIVCLAQTCKHVLNVGLI